MDTILINYLTPDNTIPKSGFNYSGGIETIVRFIGFKSSDGVYALLVFDDFYSASALSTFQAKTEKFQQEILGLTPNEFDKKTIEEKAILLKEKLTQVKMQIERNSEQMKGEQTMSRVFRGGYRKSKKPSKSKKSKKSKSRKH